MKMKRRKLIGLFVATAALAVCSPTASPAAAKTVRLLTVGNSFADNALTYLPQLAEAAGHELIVARANLGGCSFERHWNHVAAYEADTKSKDGSPYSGGKRSLADMLKREPWDFITIQQVSYKSHDPTTYEPYAEKLHHYIAERAPQAKIMIHQIWAYRVDDPRFVPKNKGREPHTHQVMYEQVRQTYHAVAKQLGIDIIPSGDAMYLADTNPQWGFKPDRSFDPATAEYPARPDQKHSLHVGWSWRKNKDGSRTLRMDGHHASEAGKYLIGCVWFETFFGTSVVDDGFVPKGLEPDYAAFLRTTAHEAVAGLAKDGR